MHQAEIFLQFEEVLEFIFELHPQGAFEFTVVEHEVGSSEDVFGMGPALELNLRAVLPLPFQLNQLDEVLKRLSSKSPKDWKEELVLLMKTILECWNQEGMDTTSLMQNSRIWDMKSKSVKRRYYNPELYCSADTLPRHIRWEKVVASAEFVIRNCETSLNSLELAILARQFRLNQIPPPVKSPQPSGWVSSPPETSHA